MSEVPLYTHHLPASTLDPPTCTLPVPAARQRSGRRGGGATRGSGAQHIHTYIYIYIYIYIHIYRERKRERDRERLNPTPSTLHPTPYSPTPYRLRRRNDEVGSAAAVGRPAGGGAPANDRHSSVTENPDRYSFVTESAIRYARATD